MEKDARSLIDKYKKGLCSPSERAVVESWYYQLKDKVKLDEDRIDEIGHELWAKLIHQQAVPNTYRLWPRVLRITGVAAAVAAITLGLWLYYTSGLFGGRHPESPVTLSLSKGNDIAPGKNMATLTLANGKTIELSNTQTGVIVGDELRYNDGSTVANLSPSGRDGVAREGNNSGDPLSPQGGSLPGGERSKAQILIASTPRGGTYQVTLPDGTHVWLNADSKISFPSRFSGKERKILLSGEAYFEVAKNKRMPFIVESKGQEVEVLGTHFNINSYADEGSTRTTLLEGSVRVAFLSPSGRDGAAREGSKNDIVLLPNQQAILSGSSQLMVNVVDPSEAIAWKNGDFLFKRESLGQFMRKVSRWYDIEVRYADDVDKNQTFSGQVSRNKNLSEVLKSLESIGVLQFKIDGKNVIVMNKQ